MGIKTSRPLETEDINRLTDIADKLSNAFDRFYKSERKLLQRKRKDIRALKARAGVEDTNTPVLLRNIVPTIHDKLVGLS